MAEKIEEEKKQELLKSWREKKANGMSSLKAAKSIGLKHDTTLRRWEREEKVASGEAIPVTEMKKGNKRGPRPKVVAEEMVWIARVPLSRVNEFIAGVK